MVYNSSLTSTFSYVFLWYVIIFFSNQKASSGVLGKRAPHFYNLSQYLLWDFMAAITLFLACITPGNSQANAVLAQSDLLVQSQQPLKGQSPLGPSWATKKLSHLSKTHRDPKLL
jgi:hypothetical protein